MHSKLSEERHYRRPGNESLLSFFDRIILTIVQFDFNKSLRSVSLPVPEDPDAIPGIAPITLSQAQSAMSVATTAASNVVSKA
jgi:hypothetical protein